MYYWYGNFDFIEGIYICIFDEIKVVMIIIDKIMILEIKVVINKLLRSDMKFERFFNAIFISNKFSI